jgi:hypothetical protein
VARPVFKTRALGSPALCELTLLAKPGLSGDAGHGRSCSESEEWALNDNPRATGFRR